MIYNQKITRAFGTPLRKGLLVGATSVVAAGSLLGVGVAGASAATAPPTPVTTHSSTSVTSTTSAHSSTSAHSRNRTVSVIEQLRATLFANTISGSKAQALATRIIANSAMFSALPAGLQSDLTTLKTASPTDAVAQAEHIKSTALAGGYGDPIEKFATALRDTAKYPISEKLVREIRLDVAKGKTAAETGALIAKSVGEDQKLLAILPANLRSDVTTLQNASPSDAATQVTKIEATAVSGDYGQQVQQLSQSLASLTAGSTK